MQTKYVQKRETVNKCLNWLDGEICKIVDSGLIAKISIEGSDPRSLQANAKYHAMIGDIHSQAVFRIPGKLFAMRDYDAEEAKALLIMWFAKEMEMHGTPLKKPPRLVVDPCTGEKYTVRPSSIDFEKEEASNFIEWLYQMGGEGGVKWSEPALKEYSEYREAQK